MKFSQRHYRLVSRPPETAADIAWRLLDNEAGKLAGKDREREFPVLRLDNFQQATAYQEERRKYWRAELEKKQK
jgi:hypothetical protein